MITAIRTRQMFTVSDFIQCEATILDSVRYDPFSDIEQDIAIHIFRAVTIKDIIADVFLNSIL